MKLETFKVESIDLTSVDPETGLYNTAAVYRIDNVDRQLSIGELVMVICLNRAVEQEEAVTSIMSSMNSTTYRLEQMAKLEDKLAELRAASQNNISTYVKTIGLSESDFDGKEWWHDWLYETMVNGSRLVDIEAVTGKKPYNIGEYSASTVDDIITAMEAKMDELNTFAQQKMIELQSATNKRDQAYDLCSAILKSFNTVLIGSANNM